MNWNISQLDRVLNTGYVYTAHWRCSATQDAASGSVYGTQSFPEPEEVTSGFTPYDSLTEEQVLGWVKGVMGEEQVKAHEAAVQAQIDAQLHPTTAAGVPWTSAPQKA